MQRIIIISLCLLQILTQGQSFVGFSDSLLMYEYKSFKSINDTDRQEFLIKKIEFCLDRNLTGATVMKDIKRINPALIKNDVTKSNFLWNAAIVSYLNDETEYCRHFAKAYSEANNDSSMAYGILLILANKYSDTALVNQTIKRLTLKDSIFKNLDCFISLATYRRKHENFYLVSSAIIPGSGTVMNGAVFKGLLSFALSAGSAYGVYRLVTEGLYINATLWGTGLGLKFYTGNIRLTEKEFERREGKQQKKLADNCELILKEILNKYPVVIKVR